MEQTTKGADQSTVMEQESPRLTDYEGEGFIARRLARSSNEKNSERLKLLAMAKQKQDKEKALKQANAERQAKEKKAQQAKEKKAVTQPCALQRLQLKFLSIGEWVEVDADRTPG